ncbi:hypothetical protein [Thermospira aquatica]|uniref:Uncharacterized protein n=1 Tax=Thermospira aquatica TaxID=2828656 RepID=A0AAX3BED3_9SPIR|nr:hypothetical protein [Thermospira aquatica]URA10590.1 hypothetical protein KDW03_01955 [Thermospira aquatica]
MAFTKCYSISNGQWQWDSYDWNNLLKSTTMGLASGFVGGWVGGELGGRYTDGNLSFIDRISSKALTNNVSLFYEMKLNNFANTIGSIAGEAVHYAWGGNFRISLGGGVGIGFTTNGQIVNDTSGGIGLVNLVDAIGSLNYVGFQYKNVHGGDEGLSRISYVNMGYLSGDLQNMKTAMDVINDKKRIEFDLEGEGEYGYAGEDNRTIHLNREAILADDDADLRAKLAHYTATVMHEGFHIDQHEWLAKNGYEMDDVILERMAYEQSTKTLALLSARFGLDVIGSKYEEVARQGAYFALTGDSDTLDMSGRSLKVKVDGKTTNVTVEDWTNTAKGRSNCIEGMAKALGVTSDKVLEALKRTGHYNGMSDEQIAKSLKVGETLVLKNGKVMTEEEAKGVDWAGVGKTVGKFLILSTPQGQMTVGTIGLVRMGYELLKGNGKTQDLASKLVSTLLRDVVGKPYYKGGGQMGVNIFASGISSGTGALGGAVQGMISGMGGAVAGAVEAVAGAGIQGLGNLAVSGLKVNEYGGLDWRMDSVQLATWGVSTIGSMVLAGVNSGYNPSTATTWEAAGYAGMNWAINSTVSFINKGWKMDESGRLYWGLTNEGEVTEAWMDLGIGTLKSGLSFVFEGNYTGYGAKQKESLIAFALGKGMDIYKYQLYQQGTFGRALQDKYAGQNAFDLAGGIDLTILTRNWKEGERSMSGAVGLRILSTGMELHSGAGEFGGFGFVLNSNGLSWQGVDTWNTMMSNFKDIGQLTANTFQGLTTGLAYLASSGWNVFSSPVSQDNRTQEREKAEKESLAATEEERRRKFKESTTLYHRRILFEKIKNIEEGPLKEKLRNMIATKRKVYDSRVSDDGNANTEKINEIVSLILKVSNKANEYAGGNATGNVTLEQLLARSENIYELLDNTNQIYSYAVGVATDIAYDKYGGDAAIRNYEKTRLGLSDEDISDEMMESGREKFSSMFEFNLQHTALTQDENVAEFDTKTNEGRKLLEMYSYFADLRGGYGSFEKSMKKDFVIFGEEGMGKGERCGKDTYNDRITVIRGGKIVEFYRGNVDASRHYEIKKGIPYSSIAPGVYEARTFYRASKSKMRENRQFTILIANGGAVPAVEGGSQKVKYEILIHIGGPDNTWSKGCQTIYGGRYTGKKMDGGYQLDGGDYTYFMGLFGTYDSEDDRWYMDYTLIGTYYLLSQ